MLLGQVSGKTVNIVNSFGIPFEEDENDSKVWFLDHNFIRVNGKVMACMRYLRK